MLKKFAEDLKYYREKTGKNLKEIAEETKLHSGILDKIENADFTFQPQLYIRAFLKQYAKAIDLSPDKVLKDYDLAQAGKYSSDIVNEKPPVDEPSNIINEIKVKEDKVPEEIEHAKENKETDDSISETSEKSLISEPEKETEPDDNKKEILRSAEKSFELPGIKKEQQEVISPSDNDIPESIKDTPQNKKKVQPLVTSQKTRTDEDIEHKVMNFKPAEKTMIASVKNDPKFATGEKYTPAIKSRSINSSVFKNILMGAVVLLVAAGLIALFKVLLFDGSSNNQEIKRQNFDEVVKENEKKILGKRSDEEIRDSIAKAEEDAKKLAAINTVKYDSLTLDVTAVDKGWMIMITDSINYKFPERIYFEKGDQETFKAKNFFHFSTPNSDALDVKLNGKKLTFDPKNFRYLKITPAGIVKK